MPQLNRPAPRFQLAPSQHLDFESGGVEMPVTFHCRLGVNTIDAASDAGLDGAGLFRAMSYQVVDLVRAGRMTAVLEPLEPSPMPVHLF